MDSVEKLTSAITMVEEARGVPLSASCVVHRGEMLEILDEARAALPTDLEDAEAIISSRDSIIEDGRISADTLVANAREEVARMVEQTSIVQAARDEAKRFSMMREPLLKKSALKLRSTLMGAWQHLK